MNKEQPLITIVTPLLNRDKYLEDLILSVKNQDYPYIEHIVADGGSTDGSIEILKKYEKIYNLKWFSGKDKGIFDAYNKAFAIATGDIFAWQDSDDFYLPGAVKKVAEIFQKHPEVDFVFGNIMYCNADGKIIDYAKRPGFDPESLLYNGMNISPQTVFFRRSLFEKLKWVDINYKMCGDYDFYLRAMKSGAEFYHIPEFLAVYRFHAGQQTSNREYMFKEAEGIRRKYIDKNITEKDIKKIKIKLFFKRNWWYLKHGEFYYLFRVFLKRIKIL